ncbi:MULTISPECIES: beta-ketoacyl synthase N-terminal-like domain-containing protein [unclassified Pseudomonas]|uniref:beta-ketoacyl synthase N-terminal-like domain-containing protein n=1 Tax=unclassified Pseudomonas TaxID=196821 RepID=UPI0035C21799
MSAGYEQVLAIVLTQLASACGVERIDEEQRLGSLGLDSIEVTGLLAALGAQLERDLDPTLFWRFATPAQLCRYLCSLEGGATQAPRRAPVNCTQPVAVTGLACRFPGARDSLAFWTLLESGGQGVGPLPEGHFSERRESGWHVALDEVAGFLDSTCDFDYSRFGLGAHEASQMDPQQRLLLTLAWDALEQAGMPPATLRGQRGGVYVGAMWSDFAHHVAPQQMTAQSATGLDTSILSARISFTLGLDGPSMTVNTACSSSLVAVHLACQALRQGECDFAIVGGVNLLLAAQSFEAMRRFGGLSQTATCHTFDAAADGYVRAEGAGVLVLRRLPEALAAGAPVWGVIRASVVNNNGFHNSLTAPSMHAQQALLNEAIRQAGIAPADVEYLEAHGTGTAMGDPIEASAIAAAYCPRGARQQALLIGSVKTNIGHSEAAAGMAGLIKVLLALQHGVIPAHLNYRTPNPAIDWSQLALQPVLERTRWSSAQPLAGVSSFGFGGTNAHVIVGRQWPVDSPEGFERSDNAQPTLVVQVPASKAKGGVLVFSGQGAQWQGMGLHLARLDPLFSACIARCDREFMSLAGWSLAERLYDAEHVFDDVEVAWPCHFAVQVALAEVWIAKGLRPLAVIGHSIGEVAAAHVAGVLNLRDALRVMLAQARWAAGQPGAMALLEMGWEPAQALLQRLQVPVQVAIQHTEDATVITGPAAAIAAVEQYCEQSKLRLRRVRCDVAVHAGSDEQGYQALCEALEDIVPCSPQLPFHGACAGGTGGGPASTAYWADVVVRPVRWFDALRTALQQTEGVLVEVSSHPVLLRSLRDAAPSRGVLVSARRGWCDASAMQQGLDECCEVQAAPSGAMQVLLLSGHNQQALQARCASIASWLEQDTPPSLADCAQALREVCSHERHRLSLVVESREQALAELRAAAQALAWDSKVCAAPLLQVRRQAPLSARQRDALLAVPAFASGYARVLQVARELGVEPARVKGVAMYIGCADYLRSEGMMVSRYAVAGMVGSIEDLTTGRLGLGLLVQGIRDLEWGEGESEGDDDVLRIEGLAGEMAGQLCSALLARAYQAGVSVTARPSTRQPPLSLPAAYTATQASPGGPSLYGIGWQEVQSEPGAALDSKGLLVVGPEPALAGLRHHPSLANAQWHVLDLAAEGDADYRTFLELLDCTPVEHLALLAQPNAAGEHLAGVVLGLLRALAKAPRSAITVHVLTHAAQHLPKDSEVCADAALLWGLLRTAQLELDSQRLCVSDLGPPFDNADGAVAQALLASLVTPMTQCAWRKGVRYVPVLQAATGLSAATCAAPADDTGFHLISGGLGALGQAMLGWRVAQGERRFLLIGRRQPSPPVAEALEAWRRQGVQIRVETFDIAEARALDDAVARTAQQLGPLSAITHAAGVLHPEALATMTPASLSVGLRAKREGAWNLHRLSEHWPVRRFLLVSSVSSLFGFPGHAAYAAGNAYLDGLAEYRISQGLPATSVGFGPFADEGLLAHEGAAQVFEHLPAIGMQEALACLAYWQTRDGCVVIMRYRGPSALAHGLPALAVGVEALAQAGDRHGQLCAIVGRFVAALLQVPVEAIAQDAPLSELGVSSLLGVEIRNRLQAELQVHMPATVLWNYPTITALATYLESLLWPLEEGLQGRSERIDAPDEDDDALMAELLRELATIKDKFSGDLH